MKLIELEIKNIRGIKHLCLGPNGKNMVIFGPNGSGKSSVVDALDFLFTGKIDRLTGEGTTGITLRDHGCNIDCNGEEAEVRASIKLPGIQSPVKIWRKMSNQNKLISGSQDQRIDEILVIAGRRENILTRKDILKYIASTAQSRAEEIHKLLDISEIEDIRKAFVAVLNRLKEKHRTAINQLTKAKESVNATTQEKTFSESNVINLINENRLALGGSPISKLAFDEIKNGLLQLENVAINQQINPVLAGRDIKNLYNTLSDVNREKLFKDVEQLRELITNISSKPELVNLLKQHDLIKMGLELLEPDGKCPLCDTEWAPGELKKYLDNKLKLAASTRETRDKIDSLSRSIKNSLIVPIESLEKLVPLMKAIELTEGIDTLLEWKENLQGLLDSIETSIADYREQICDNETVMNIIAPSEVLQKLELVESNIKSKIPKPTNQQTAWDTLTRLEENVKRLNDAELEFKRTEEAAGRASALLNTLMESRNRVLEEVYKEIEDRFVSLYRKLHDDEGKLRAKLEPTKSGLNFRVDFHNRGLYPPCALHSEGHQDSMGLCLYFALSEYLTAGVLDLIILDDVVMSIDADHRRKLCDLMQEEFSGKQFIITTHDRIWKQQLLNTRVVNSENIWEFYNWKIEIGATANKVKDMWEKIDESLESNNVSLAAYYLRRGGEEFLGRVCNELAPSVVYRSDAKWNFGELLDSAIREFKCLISDAIPVADKDTCVELQKRKEIIDDAVRVAKIDQWAINRNIHWNEMWADFSVNDFKPVVEAFKRLFNSFTCEKCGEILQICKVGSKKRRITCKCNAIDWKLP